ncbi:MAG: Fe-S cluster assembly protein SufD [bacterium]|nr:Fe-S cluster assembly protein SufD [bacterium]
MPAVKERSPFVEAYESFDKSLGSQGEAVKRLRREGLEVFEEIGLPSKRQEEWRKTNVAALGSTSFRRASGGTSGLTPEKIRPFLLPDCIDLVFVNGRFSAELSRPGALPEGVFAGSLADAMARHADLVEPLLGHYADGKHPFVALNTAHIEDGAFIHVPRGVAVEKTIHLLFLGTTEGGEAVVSYPRNLFVAGQSSQLTVVESYCGFGDERYFHCPVTEIVGEANSVLDHYRLGQESLGAYHVATQKIHLERDTNFFTHSINHGGALVRNDIQAMLDGEGIHCTLNGLYLARGAQHVDHQMRVDHAKPNCHSYELFKGILEDRARAVFNGRIYVHQDAQKTDAKQSNRNLLLSKDALVHSNPQLEIFADDVRCTHGSTTGHLDDEAVFYLRSRGIGEEAARSLLTYSFAGEVLDEIRLEAVRKDLEEFLFTRLPKGNIVRQAV